MDQRTRKLFSEMQEDWGMHQSKLKKCKETLSGKPLRLIKGVEPDAMKVASPVPNGGDEETCKSNAPCPYPTAGCGKSCTSGSKWRLRHEVASVIVVLDTTS